jgi:hypothetical protein
MQPSPSGKVKVILYYWPHVNSNQGHLACVVEEADGKNRKIHITSGLFSFRSSSSEKYLMEELKAYDFLNAIKIELPISKVTYDEFEKIEKEIFQTNKSTNKISPAMNSTSWSGIMLKKIYNKIPPAIPANPRSLATAACNYLDTIEQKQNYAERLSSLESESKNRTSIIVNNSTQTKEPVCLISKFTFAREMMGVALETIKDALPKEPNSVIQSLSNAFMKILNSGGIYDSEITGKFKALNKEIEKIEKTLKVNAGFFQELKLWFYGLMHIIAQDPELKNLQQFRQAADETKKYFKEVEKIKQENIPLEF